MGIQEASDELLKLLMQSVAPESWRDVGGSVGRIQYFSGRLVVFQTPAVHRAIAAFLDMLQNAPDWPTSPATIVRVPTTRPVDPILAMHVHLPAYRQTTLTKVIEDLGEATHLDTFIRRAMIERSGIYATIEVNCGEFDGPLSSALQMIEDAVEAASNGIRFRFQVRNKLIVFSSADDLRVETVLRSYDVRDLLRADLEEQHRLLAASKGQWVQWDYQEIDHALQRLTTVIAKADTRVDVEGDQFIDAKTQEVAGEMHYWGGRLFIRRPVDGLDRIEAMLGQLRRMRTYPPPSTRPAPVARGHP